MRAAKERSTRSIFTLAWWSSLLRNQPIRLQLVDFTLLFVNISCNVTNYVCIDLAAEELATLQDAFDKYLNYTCITFEERTDQVNYVSIKKTGGG